MICDSLKTEGYLRAEIRSIEAGHVGLQLWHYQGFKGDRQSVRLAYRSRGSEVAQRVGDVQQRASNSAHISCYNDFPVLEQQWVALESSRQTIAILTVKLRAHEEKSASGDDRYSSAQGSIASMTNNNGIDKKKKKNSDWKKKVKCFGCRHNMRDCHKKDGGQDGGRKKEEAYCLYVDTSVTANS